MVDYVSVDGDRVTYLYKPGVKLSVNTMNELSDDDYDENEGSEDTGSVTFKINAPENLEAWLSDRFVEDGVDEEDRLGWFDEIDSRVDEARNGNAVKALVEESFSKYMPSVINQNNLEGQDYKSVVLLEGQDYKSVVLLVALVYAITRRDGEAEVVISAR